MACPYEEKLTSWLLGDLSPQEQDEVTCHVFVCEACKKECEALRSVLFPLRSALHKDQGLFKERKPRRWAQGVFTAPWLRQAAILLLSCSIVCLVMTLYYYQLTRQTAVDGPVTHITFGKREEPPPPLEPLPMPANTGTDLLAKVNIVDELGLADIEDVPLPVLPGGAWVPQFVTLNQLAMWHAFDKRSEAVHDRLMRDLPDVNWEAEPDPIRRSRKTRRHVMTYGPTVLASPRYVGPTNRTPKAVKGQ